MMLNKCACEGFHFQTDSECLSKRKMINVSSKCASPRGSKLTFKVVIGSLRHLQFDVCYHERAQKLRIALGLVVSKALRLNGE